MGVSLGQTPFTLPKSDPAGRRPVAEVVASFTWGSFSFTSDWRVFVTWDRFRAACEQFLALFNHQFSLRVRALQPLWHACCGPQV